MAHDRRSLLLSLIAVGAMPGCAKASPPRIRTGLLSDRFFQPDGRIVDTGNGGVSHTEGQGFAMLVAEARADREAFDRLWTWTRGTLMRADVALFSWRYDPRAEPKVTDPNNATDGDIFIAWALARAAARWRDPGYRAASDRIRAAIRERLIVPVGGRTLLLPGLDGFRRPTSATINPSYYVWPALDAFRRLDGARAWQPLIADGERLLGEGGFGRWRLPTDWIDLSAEGVPSPAAGRPPRFGFDAVRVPLYLAWSGRYAMLDRYRTYWRSLAAQRQAIPAWIDVRTDEVAPFAVSNGANAIVRLTLGTPPAAGFTPDGDYYSTALSELSAIASRRS